MGEHKNVFKLAGETKEATQLYVKYKIDYYKLHLAERITNVAAFMISGVLLLMMLSLFLLFTSLALAFFLGSMLGNDAYGFLIVGTIYLIGIVLLGMLRGRLIQKPILRIVIKELFPKPKNRKQ